jgi:hypothetical protein
MKIHLAAVLLAACAGTSADDDDTNDTDTTPGTSDTSTPGDTDVDPVEPQSLTGTLLESDGATPLVGWSVKFCNVIGCRIDESDTSGVVEYTDVVILPYSLEPVPPEGSDWATMNFPYTFEPNEDKVLTLVQQELGPLTTLTGTPVEIELGDGLWVTIGSGDLEPPALHDPATTAGGVAVPQADWPTIDDVTGTVLAVWYTHPFDYSAPNGLPVRIEGNLGLGEGASVDLLVGSYSHFAWLEAGSLTVTGGELVGSAELPLLSTVIAVQR